MTKLSSGDPRGEGDNPCVNIQDDGVEVSMMRLEPHRIRRDENMPSKHQHSPLQQYFADLWGGNLDSLLTVKIFHCCIS